MVAIRVSRVGRFAVSGGTCIPNDWFFRAALDALRHRISLRLEETFEARAAHMDRGIDSYKISCSSFRPATHP